MHTNKKEVSLARLSILALIIGVATGYGAVAFRKLIGLIHNLAHKNFTIVREKDVMFDVIKRMSRRGNKLALVVKNNLIIPRACDLPGFISNDDIAESVAESLAFRIKPNN
jgi:hypothetical protein